MSRDAQVLKRVKTVAADGRPSIQYRIQLVDESLIDETVSFLVEYAVPYENWFSTLDILSDAKAVKELEDIFKYRLSQEISLGAFLEDDRGNRGPMIGCNVLYAEKEDDLVIDCQTEKLRTLLHTLTDLESRADIPESFDCFNYVHTLGLVVAPAFRRQGIATEILRARDEICRMTNIPVCASAFSAEAAMKAAANCGYKTLAELDLSTYRINGRIAFPNPKWPTTSKWMAKRCF